MFRAETEIVSLVDINHSNKTENINLVLPNSMYAHGIAIALENATTCAETESGNFKRFE